MRLWSIHPKYLDLKGLVALWREALLAQNVLLGKTKGYKYHPQLIRFQNHSDSISAIGSYLYYIFLEAEGRGYSFNVDKILQSKISINKIDVTDKQVEYEFRHLQNKLITRNIDKFNAINVTQNIEVHQFFNIIKGDIEKWEILNKTT